MNLNKEIETSGVNTLLLVGMLVLGVILLLSKQYFFTAVLVFSFIVGLFFLNITSALKLPEYQTTLVLIFLWLSILGEIGVYSRLEFYDKVLHFVVPFFMTLIVSTYIYRFDIKYKKFLIFFVILGLGASFEVFEFVMDYALGLDMAGVMNISGEKLMAEWHDTIWDLIMTMGGSLLFLIFKNGKTKLRNNNTK